jgi:hypothetical protein
MFIKITAAETSIRYVPPEEMGIRENREARKVVGYPWTYIIIDKPLFFLSVIKYGIKFEEYVKCST